MGKRVLVTGCSGYIGELLVRHLLTHPLVQKTVAVDVKPSPLPQGPKFKHYAADIRDEFLLRSLLEEERIDTVFHLAFLSEESKGVLARAVNVDGSLTVLDAAHKSSTVSKLIVTSSSLAYGARSDNPRPLREENPLRATTFPYAVHKRLVEEEIGKVLPQIRRNLQVSILRVCTVVGPHERREGPIRFFCRSPLGVTSILRPGGIQFLAEEDLLKVLTRAMETPEFRGTYNVAPDDFTTVAALCRSLGKTRLALPYPLIWAWFYLRKRMNPRSPIDEDLARLISHPIILSNEKIKKALGITFQKTSEEAFLECARALSNGHEAPR